jgi:pimeloyl-ACP methyl ester carboxylesterase
MYQPQRISTSEFLLIRGLRTHLRCWGGADKPLLLLVHGWMDVGASFQFLVDALSDAFFATHRIVAPDWRGYGLTDRPQADCYWFPDYVADLDAIAHHLSPDTPFKLVGHSMGGNVAMLYAGVQPARVSHLVNLEGFGMPRTKPEQAPKRYAQWLAELRDGASMKPYTSLTEVATRLMKNNPRLEADKAAWLAQHWAKADAQGLYHVLGDPAHKITYPVLYQADEVMACWRQITAPVLTVEGSATEVTRFWGNRYTVEEFHERLRAVPHHRLSVIQGAGHMLHHEQPAQLARLIEAHVA